MELWQRFTHRARRSILLAHDEAAQMRCPLIGTEHLLLGLIRLGEGMAADIFEALGVDTARLRGGITDQAQLSQEQTHSAEISFTPEAQRVLQLAYQRSCEMQDRHIGTEHLLLALVQEPRGASWEALNAVGVDAARVEEAIAALRAERAGVSEPEAARGTQSVEAGGGRKARSESTTRQPLSSARIPPAVGPYSQAIRAGDYLFCSGIVGLSPETGKLVDGEFESEVRQVLDNLRALLEDCESGLDRVVKTTVFLTDIAQFPAFNEIYAGYFSDNPPARSTVQVAALPLGARIEVEAIALA
ncbi:MAG: Rid family detoxifying hydrolase [Armatimonadota bacterium]